MIGVDSSSFIAYLEGDEGEDVELVSKAIHDETLIMPPPVVTELLSARNLSDDASEAIKAIPQLPPKPGYWERAGLARATILRAGKKARTIDSLIATYCSDHGIPLIQRDSDYRHHAEYFGLVTLP